MIFKHVALNFRSSNYNKEKFVDDCYKIYSPEKEKIFGVLGIRVELI
jgi:ASC-1-like (ASCH) protein